MAAITPVASDGAGGVDVYRGLYTGEISSSESMLVEGVRVNTRPNFILEIVHFAAGVNTGDTWTSNIAGIQAVAYQQNIGSAENVAAILTTQASGLITFITDDDAPGNEGWLWLLIDPSVARRPGTPTR